MNLIEGVEKLKSISDELRVRIILILYNNKLCVCELMEIFDMRQSHISHHLLLLKRENIIQDEKKGKWTYYFIDKNVQPYENKYLIDMLYSWFSSSKEHTQDCDKLTELLNNKEKKTLCD